MEPTFEKWSWWVTPLTNNMLILHYILTFPTVELKHIDHFRVRATFFFQLFSWRTVFPSLHFEQRTGPHRKSPSGLDRERPSCEERRSAGIAPACTLSGRWRCPDPALSCNVFNGVPTQNGANWCHSHISPRFFIASCNHTCLSLFGQHIVKHKVINNDMLL